MFFLHFVHSTLHLLTFLLLSHWLSRLCGAKYALPFSPLFHLQSIWFRLTLALFPGRWQRLFLERTWRILTEEENIYGSF